MFTYATIYLSFFVTVGVVALLALLMPRRALIRFTIKRIQRIRGFSGMRLQSVYRFLKEF